MNQCTDSCCLSSHPSGAVFEACSARPVPKVLRWMFGAVLRRLSCGISMGKAWTIFII